jgi:hypothetical protein
MWLIASTREKKNVVYDVRRLLGASSTDEVQESDSDGLGRFLRDDHKVS